MKSTSLKPSPAGVCVLAWLALALLFTGFSPRAEAQVIYSTDFNGSVGTFPGAGPTYADWKAATSGSPTFSLTGDGLLQVTNPANAASSSQYATAYWTGNGGVVNGGMLSDGKITASIQFIANTNQSMGVLARVQSPFDNAHPEGYFAGIVRYDNGGGNMNYLVISKNINFAVVKDSILVSSAALSISSGNFYTLSFEFTGTSLAATLKNAAGDTQIASIAVADSTYSLGLTGLRTNFAAKDRVIGYDRYQLEGIPEPSTAALIPVGIALFLAGSRFRKLRK